MASISSIALSGMNAAQNQLQASANNVANSLTPGYRRQQVALTPSVGGGVQSQVTQASVSGASLETDVVAQLQAKNSFLANLAVFKTSNQLVGSLLDQKA